MRSLETFISALRASDVAVSPAEAIDAHLAAASVGWTDRTLLKDALCATLAKSAFEVERFDACFETFFRREEFRRGAAPTAASAAGKEDLVAALLAGDGASLAASMEAAGVQAGVSEIRLSTQRSLIVRRILDLMGMRRLERRIAELEGSADADERGLAGELAGRRSQLFEEAERFVARQERLHAGQSAKRLREQILERQRLTTIAPEDLRAMEALTRRMARRLATRYARRRRRARRGDLDVRKTVAASMAHDGIPFQVIWKRQKIDKPKLMVLCDVSRSVAEAARFLLLFVYSLSEAVEHLEAYAFSDRLACVDDLLAEVSVEEAIALVMARSGLRPTDYGASLADFVAAADLRLDRRTTVIILGDGRCNYASPRLDLMRRIKDRSKAVVWLNPEPSTYWGQGDSKMADYARFCHLARSCNSLAELQRIVDQVMAAYLPR